MKRGSRSRSWDRRPCQVGRFADDLTETSLKFGILPRFQQVTAVKPALVGKVLNGGNLPREAASIATFASGWLTKELRRTVPVEPLADGGVAPRTMFLILPSL